MIKRIVILQLLYMEKFLRVGVVDLPIQVQQKSPLLRTLVTYFFVYIMLQVMFLSRIA